MQTFIDPDLLDQLRVGPLVSMARHTHQYTIGDDEAVKVLLDKLLSGGSHQQRREKLLKALDEASQTPQLALFRFRNKILDPSIRS